MKLYGPHEGATLGRYVSVQPVVPPAASEPPVETVRSVPPLVLQVAMSVATLPVSVEKEAPTQS